MVRIERYNSEVEEKYWQCVLAVLQKVKSMDEQIIIQSCQKFLPPDFFTENTDLKELVLAPFEKLKLAYDYIQRDNCSTMNQECFGSSTAILQQRTPVYDTLYKAYEKVRDKKVDNIKLNVFIVYQTGLTVCPYCNRDYINSREKNHAGAQMDHFYPRSEYPIFSLCLYNLVPVCGNCNRIKSSQGKEFASPFDDTVDWENNVRFSYTFLDSNKIKISINVSDKRIYNNIAAMEIENAYQIHDREIRELLDKKEVYSYTQIKEFQDMLGKVGLTEKKLTKMVFGEKITEEGMKTKPLGRMMRDLERELHIFDE